MLTGIRFENIDSTDRACGASGIGVTQQRITALRTLENHHGGALWTEFGSIHAPLFMGKHMKVTGTVRTEGEGWHVSYHKFS
jgi:hypothetical protein